MFAMGDFLFYLVTHVTYFCTHYCALTLILDSTLVFVAKVCSHSHFDYPLYMFGFYCNII